ncbi:hypothetical protein TrLO_g11028 [Triparma laevis f. longispina]|uniref:Uncharacterized protein n=1 Tax=Triparma laevis f. longispina TaxID=1714387 RepID=A0A9W7CM46_9STRA|nr:hypothetical protein TrLO_g11028 [Triparma laevis f. longispina]
MLGSGLVDDRFPSGLFLGGYLNFEEVFKLRLVNKIFHVVIADSAFSDSLPDWARICSFLNDVNGIDPESNSMKAGTPPTTTYSLQTLTLARLMVKPRCPPTTKPLLSSSSKSNALPTSASYSVTRKRCRMGVHVLRSS